MSNRVQVERMRLSPQSTASARPVDTYVGVEKVGKTKTAQLMEALGVGVKTAAKSIEEYDKLELINQQANARSFMNTYKDALAQNYLTNPNMTQEEAIASLGEAAVAEYNSLTEGFATERTRDVFKGHMDSVIGSNLAAMQQDGLRVQRDNFIAQNYSSVFEDIADQVALNGRMLPSVEKEKYNELLQPSLSALENEFKKQGMKPADFKTGFLQEAKLQAGKGNPYLAQYIVDQGLYSPNERAELQNLATNASNGRIAEQRDQFAQEIFELRDAVTGVNATALTKGQQAMLDEFLEEGIVSREFAIDTMASGFNADERRAAELAKAQKEAAEAQAQEQAENRAFDFLVKAEGKIDAGVLLSDEEVEFITEQRDRGFITNANYKAILDKNNKLFNDGVDEDTVVAELTEIARMQELIGDQTVIIEEAGQEIPQETIDTLRAQAIESRDRSLVKSVSALDKKNKALRVNNQKANALLPVLAQGALQDPRYAGEFTSEQKQMALTQMLQSYTAAGDEGSLALLKVAKVADANGIKFDYIANQFEQAMTFGVPDLANEDKVNAARQAVELYRQMKLNGVADRYFAGMTGKARKLRTLDTLMQHTQAPVAQAMQTIAELEQRGAEDVFKERWAVATTGYDTAVSMMKDRSGADNTNFLVKPMSRLYSIYKSTGMFDHDEAMEKAAEEVLDEYTEVNGKLYPKGHEGAIAISKQGEDGVYAVFNALVKDPKYNVSLEQVEELMQDYNYEDVYFTPADSLGSFYLVADRETNLPVAGMGAIPITNATLKAADTLGRNKTISERIITVLRKGVPITQYFYDDPNKIGE